MDEREATIAEVGERVKILTEITNKKTGKGFGDADYKEYFKEVISFLEEKPLDNIILAGPGFAKNNLKKEWKSDKKIFIDSSSHTGVVGISEIIKRGTIEKVSRDSRISKETKAVEEFFKELSKDGLVAYGEKEVEEAVVNGAIEKLLISEEKTREFEDLMNTAEKMKTEIMIISERHESGEKLKNIGGIAAFLRYKT